MLLRIHKSREQITGEHRFYKPDRPPVGQLAEAQSRRETLDAELTPESDGSQVTGDNRSSRARKWSPHRGSRKWRQLPFAAAGAISAPDMSVTKFKYNESVIFSHSRIRCLRWQRTGWACSHRTTRGEGQCDYSEECGAWRCEGHTKSRPQSGQFLHSINRGILRSLVATADVRCAHSVVT